MILGSLTAFTDGQFEAWEDYKATRREKATEQARAAKEAEKKETQQERKSDKKDAEKLKKEVIKPRGEERRESIWRLRQF